ncbi:MAG TPA: hypothetical protein VHP11_07305, partial [Tepidisphaeraceae bacterium]|nr:hypothetical protein [Tepidisphaeraceae bacterium]
RSVLRLCLLTAVTGLGSTSISPASVSVDTERDSTVSALPQVRLRKLHLVRPDLIPYPIVYEAIC